MKRHPCLALVTPLFVSSVAFAPAVSALGHPEERPSSVSAAPTVAKCELTRGKPDAQRKPTYVLRLSGFTKQKVVTARSADQKFSVSGTTSDDGSFQSTVPRGRYVAQELNGKTIRCSLVPVEKGPEVTDLDVQITPNSGTPSCNPLTFTMTIKITSSGAGTVDYRWDLTHKGDFGGGAPGKVEFTGPGTKEETKTYGASPDKAGEVHSGKVVVKILTGPSKGKTDQAPLSFTCA
ncbi:hypothetical protein [Streptomyces sp. NPDC000410]|uniref:hypothetical protein n=1 Tax=Streptomyces sp. NPDC000410 TaxID=3154254 RepID=UPI003332A0CD